MLWIQLPAFLCALSACACSPSPATPAFAQSPADEKAKLEAFTVVAAACDLAAIKARVPPAPSEQAPEPPPHVQPKAEPFVPHAFLELAVFVVPTGTLTSQVDPGALAQHPAVQLLGVPHLAAPAGSPTRLGLAEHVGPLARPSLREIVASVQPANGGVHSAELTMTLQLPTHPNTLIPAESRVQLVTAARERALARADSPIPGLPGRSLLVLFSLYPVREEADLRALFTCKFENQRR